MKKNLIILTSAIFIFLSGSAQDNNAGMTRLQSTVISGEWFLGFKYDDSEEFSAFHLKRGYLTIKTELNDIFSVRYTQDITTDMEGSDMGNVEMKLKYLLLKARLSNIEFLKNSYMEFGMVHRPWLEYEQNISGYRVQGKMFSDRYGLLSSADFGITFAGLLGGRLNQEYQEDVSSYFPGRYGSFCFGIYNGGGYDALEKNNNKIIEGRLSLRPLPDIIPGVQLSYAFSYGKADTSFNNSLYRLNILHLSSVSRHHKLMVQYYRGLGGHRDDYIDSEGRSYRNEGYSGFAELMIPGTPFAVFSRYDKITSYQDTDITRNTIIAGITYRFLRNKVLLNFDQTENMGVYTRIYEIALEINF